MSRTILLVSRNPVLQAGEAALLERAGYHTLRCASMTAALQMAAHSQLSLIDDSFRIAEQDDFIEHVHECNPGIFVLCIRHAQLDPQALMHAIAECFHAQPGGSRVCILGASNVLSWPRKAS